MNGSDDCWGMVDWEAGTCDFSGELFARMLKAAKRYGYTWEDINAERFRDVPSASIAISCCLAYYKTPEELAAMGVAAAGTMFEDGCHPSSMDVGSAFAINANSDQKEGAWEFIRFLISEECQLNSYGGPSLSNPPLSNRKALQTCIQKGLRELEENPYFSVGEQISVPNFYTGETEEMDFHYYREDFTEERIEGYLAMLEDIRDITPSYTRMLPIQRIISEEAEFYFTGVKTIEEVVDLINNRVGLYLQERQ